VRVPHAQRDELGTLARNFNLMVATLESNEALRRHFMADISHELRTPLSVLQAQLEAMEDGIEPIDASSLRALLDEVATLTRLVEDMRQITLSEVGAFDYRREALDLVALLASEVHKWREPFVLAGMEITSDTPAALTIEGDTVRLRQLLRNLFNNTLRHAEGATQCASACMCCASSGADLGRQRRGVADANLPMLFERFWRGDRARTRTTGGSGGFVDLPQHRGSARRQHQRRADAGDAAARLAIRITLPLAGAEHERTARIGGRR
jgi:two-component system sensor histidine kinase BaeS